MSYTTTSIRLPVYINACFWISMKCLLRRLKAYWCLDEGLGNWRLYSEICPRHPPCQHLSRPVRGGKIVTALLIQRKLVSNMNVVAMAERRHRQLTRDNSPPAVRRNSNGTYITANKADSVRQLRAGVVSDILKRGLILDITNICIYIMMWVQNDVCRLCSKPCLGTQPHPRCHWW